MLCICTARGAQITFPTQPSIGKALLHTGSEMVRLAWFALAVLCSTIVMAEHAPSWGKPGCHKVGHTRKVSIPDCVEFHVTTNACRGFCESWAVPSPRETLLASPHQAITSVGQCCNIIDTEDVEVRVLCLEGPRDLVFKSAKSCSCYHCKKD